MSINCLVAHAWGQDTSAGLQLETLSIDATFGGGFAGGDVFVGRSPVWNLDINTGAS